MKNLNKSNIIKYTLSIIILFIILYFVTSRYNHKKIYKNNYNIITSSIIRDNIIVFYPYYKNSDTLNNSIRNYIYKYIKENKNKQINIDYIIYTNTSYNNLVFKINNSIYYNIIYDSNNNIISITDIYDKLRLKEMISDLVKEKYSKEILSEIELFDINSFSYVIDDKYVFIYFNDLFDKFNYIPYIKINQSDLL